MTCMEGVRYRSKFLACLALEAGWQLFRTGDTIAKLSMLADCVFMIMSRPPSPRPFLPLSPSSSLSLPPSVAPLSLPLSLSALISVLIRAACSETAARAGTAQEQ